MCWFEDGIPFEELFMCVNHKKLLENQWYVEYLDSLSFNDLELMFLETEVEKNLWREIKPYKRRAIKKVMREYGI